MYRKFGIVLILAVVVFASCAYARIDKKIIASTKQMTMTTTKIGEVRFHLSGIGTAHIDWGDGTAHETVRFLRKKSRSTILWHHYNTSIPRTITIVGKNVTYLSCSENQLTVLDVSKNGALARLDCGRNQLTTLDVGKNVVLTSLLCHENQLTDLYVSKNAALTFLACNNNQLTDLNLSKNAALTMLYCQNNRLTSLGVSKNIKLDKLDCSNNQLTILDMSNNTALTLLKCYENQLNSLDLSQNIALMTLNIRYNQFDVNALNAMFETLHSNDTTVDITIHSIVMRFAKMVDIDGNPGTETCDRSIATDKKWSVLINNIHSPTN